MRVSRVLPARRLCVVQVLKDLAEQITAGRITGSGRVLFVELSAKLAPTIQKLGAVAAADGWMTAGGDGGEEESKEGFAGPSDAMASSLVFGLLSASDTEAAAMLAAAAYVSRPAGPQPNKLPAASSVAVSLVCIVAAPRVTVALLGSFLGVREGAGRVIWTCV